MALAANRIRVQQYGDAVVGEQTQLVYDEETGILGQKKTIVAQVPFEGGGMAYVAAEQVEVERVVRSWFSFAAQLQSSTVASPITARLDSLYATTSWYVVYTPAVYYTADLVHVVVTNLRLIHTIIYISVTPIHTS